MATPLEQKTRCWQVAGRSVRGASHLRSGMPNQDAIAWTEIGESAEGLLLAVADGHGSAKCFRSEQGSRFAVDSALAVLAKPESVAWDEVPGDLVRYWRQTVHHHLAENPVTVAEMRELERKAGVAARRTLESDPLIAYGSTLLAAIVSESATVCLQLGDGDILLVSEHCEVSRPWGRDEESLGDETNSLATRNAAAAFRMHRIEGSEPLPELLLLSTDGYANSFREDRGFLAVGPDLLQMIRGEGLHPVNQQLEAWLNEASTHGSGDDITLGMLWRSTASGGER